jgi:WD40 repeat protein
MKIQRILIMVLFHLVGFVCSFSSPVFVSHTRRTLLHSSSGDNSNDWMESLRARQLDLDQQQELLENKWRNSKCESTTSLAFRDSVRGLDVGDYPIVAVGSLSGNVYCANLETGQALGRSVDQEEEEPLVGQEELMRILFSGFDSGGTLAIAMHKTLICSAGRQGSVQLWRLDAKEPAKLISQGRLQALQGVLVTCLELDDEYLWVGTADGRVQAYTHQSKELPLALQMKPELEWNLGSAILSLSLCPEMGHGVVTTAKGTVELFSLEDDDAMVAKWRPPFESTVRQSPNCYILSCAMVPYKEEGGGYTMVCGCSDGTMYVQPLNYENGMLVDDGCKLKALKATGPSYRQLQPQHSGLVKCLTSPVPGVMLSGGQDGSLRVWDISEDDSHYLYQFVGDKVWLGTLWTDGTRIVSEGPDNTIIVHDFSGAEQ